MARKPRSEEHLVQLTPQQPEELPHGDEKQHEEEQRRAKLMSVAQQITRIMDILVERDTSERALATLAADVLTVDSWQLRYMTVERLGRQILLNRDYTQEELQQWLIPYALSDQEDCVRRAAIKLLTDIDALGKSATEDPESVVRRRAVMRLMDFLENEAACAALGKVALNDPESALRLNALLAINDQTVLAQIAMTDAVADLRKAATQKLRVQDDLAYVAITDNDLQVRLAAAMLITEPQALARAAQKIVAGPLHSAEDLSGEIDAIASELPTFG
jgi:hypothetical protein